MIRKSTSLQPFEAGSADPDPAETAQDLWFLPGPDAAEDITPPHSPGALRAPLFKPAEWRAAEAMLTADLAALCHDAGRLQERLAVMGEGARMRLAVQEATSLGWWTGDRIGADQLTLWLTLHLGSVRDDAQSLSRLTWVVRCLSASVTRSMLQPAGSLAWMRAELGVAATVSDFPRGEEAAEALQGMEGLHRITLACLLFHVWRLSGDDVARQTEAVTLGLRMMGGPAGFLPLTLAGLGAVTTTGSAERRLSAWIAGAHHATLAALLHLDRLRRWQDRATAATTDLSGRTPAILIAALVRLPMLSASAAEAETGASRASVQRNLARLQARGLIREITGQGRFRVWTAKL